MKRPIPGDLEAKKAYLGGGSGHLVEFGGQHRSDAFGADKLIEQIGHRQQDLLVQAGVSMANFRQHLVARGIRVGVGRGQRQTQRQVCGVRNRRSWRPVHPICCAH